MSSNSLREQVEFYFSDANLANDRFMLKQVKSNDDGAVFIDTIASFNRVKAMISNPQDIVSALENSELLTVKDNKIFRKVPFAEGAKSENDDKTLVVGGFPLDATLDEMIEFFKSIADIELVRRRNKDGAFSGSAWVQVKSLDDLDKFENLKYKNEALEIIRKKAFLASVAAKKNNKRKLDPSYSKNCLLHLKIDDIENQSDVRESDIRDFFSGLASVKAVKFSDGDKSWFVEFDDPVVPGILDQNKENAFTVNEKTVQILPLDEKLEENYYSGTSSSCEKPATVTDEILIELGSCLKFKFGNEPDNLKYSELRDYFKVAAISSGGKVRNLEYPLQGEDKYAGVVRTTGIKASELKAKLESETLFREGLTFSVLEGEEENAYIETAKNRILQSSKSSKQSKRKHLSKRQRK